ncbi:hypothetical protein EVAR_99749_1 [Eumeta japonica]|uniref:Uncharacterized protein n=1 Tax=Eumeta variegata TaxID=151549 RepID=A0A4C2A3U2_EUMVA|nr:hypothetical protein EVAR_99749_1 [Eumeta japonica]
MSIKLHFLHSHLDRFPENLGDMSEEQGERMRQDLRVMEERYQGFCDTNIMADYCCGEKSPELPTVQPLKGLCKVHATAEEISSVSNKIVKQTGTVIVVVICEL